MVENGSININIGPSREQEWNRPSSPLELALERVNSQPDEYRVKGSNRLSASGRELARTTLEEALSRRGESLSGLQRDVRLERAGLMVKRLQTRAEAFETGIDKTGDLRTISLEQNLLASINQQIIARQDAGLREKIGSAFLKSKVEISQLRAELGPKAKNLPEAFLVNILVSRELAHIKAEEKRQRSETQIVKAERWMQKMESRVRDLTSRLGRTLENKFAVLQFEAERTITQIRRHPALTTLSAIFILGLAASLTESDRLKPNKKDSIPDSSTAKLGLVQSSLDNFASSPLISPEVTEQKAFARASAAHPEAPTSQTISKEPPRVKSDPRVLSPQTEEAQPVQKSVQKVEPEIKTASVYEMVGANVDWPLGMTNEQARNQIKELENNGYHSTRLVISLKNLDKQWPVIEELLKSDLKPVFVATWDTVSDQWFGRLIREYEANIGNPAFREGFSKDFAHEFLSVVKKLAILAGNKPVQIEVWNEPNAAHDRIPALDPVTYASFITEIDNQITAEGLNGKIIPVFGALFGPEKEFVPRENTPTYLDRVLTNLPKIKNQHFFSVHLYQGRTSPLSELGDRFKEIVDTLRKYGQNTLVLITETGVGNGVLADLDLTRANALEQILAAYAPHANNLVDIQLFQPKSSLEYGGDALLNMKSVTLREEVAPSSKKAENSPVKSNQAASMATANPTLPRGLGGR